MISLCQLDRKWSSNYLGHSRATIGRWGCTTTAIAMLMSKFTKDYLTPAEAAKQFSYLASGPQAGALLWTSDFGPLKFLQRRYGKNSAEIADFANSSKKGVIIAVNGDSHWLVVDSVVNGVVYVYDPINFMGREKLSSRYKISGYALFESKVKEKNIPNDNEIPEWAKEQADFYKEKGIINHWDTPNREVSPAEYEIIFQRLGGLKRKELKGTVTKAELAVIMDRLDLGK